MSVRFGTDGVRGEAGSELTPELAVALGRAAARELGGGRWYVGADPRRSGGMLVAAFSAGLAAQGVDVIDLGVVPTPAVAFACQADGVPGAMVSASHNPFADNGIKLFSAGGRKLVDEVEQRIEADLMAREWGPALVGRAIGTIGHDADGSLAERYVDHVVAQLEGRSLAGLRVVCDVANGAAHDMGPRVLRALGATVTVLHDAPDGLNINEDCGSTHLARLAAAVVAEGAACGVAFDGDADRCLAVDASGATVDGDQLLALLAIDLNVRGRLANSTLVATVYSNLGLNVAMREAGIHLVVTANGDRYVLDALAAGGHSLGGEQSGHVILADAATTGDGILTAVAMLDVMARTSRSLADLAGVVTRMPQVLVNVPVGPGQRDLIAAHPSVVAAVLAAEAELGEAGRVLLRPSGTESLVRVMVEAPTVDVAAEIADRIAGVVGSAT